MKRVDVFGGSPIESGKVGGRHTLRVANEVVVQLKPDLAWDQKTRDLIFKALPKDSRLQRDFDLSGLGVVWVPGWADLDAVIKRLSRERSVVYAEPHYIDQL